jgi:hypothetical protein
MQVLTNIVFKELTDRIEHKKNKVRPDFYK